MKNSFDESRAPRVVEGRLLPGNAQKTAAAYKSRIPQANERAMAISMGLNNAFQAQMAALNQYFTSAGYEQSIARYTVLRVLHFSEGERRTLNEIRSELAVTSGNITFLVDNLEKAGLVQRVPHATDRRVTELQLTPEGSDVAETLTRTMASFMGETGRGFSEAEMQLFISLLDRFHRNTLAIITELEE